MHYPHFIYLIFLLAIPGFCQFHFHGETLLLEQAQKAHRPIVAVFLTEKNCPWSEQLQEEILSSSFFKEKVEQEALVWPVILGENAEDLSLEKAYGIQQCPVMLLLDPQGKEFARLAYEGGDPLGVSSQVVSLINGFQEVCKAVDLGLYTLDEQQLIRVYRQAQPLSQPYFCQAILEVGVQKESGTFFLLKKYAEILRKCKLKDPIALKCKQQLLRKDPDNKQGVHFEVALLDFEKKKMTLKGRGSDEKVLAPLLKYLSRFGKTDTQRVWRIELLIAEFFLSKHALHKALAHATLAYEHAPESKKLQLLQTLSYMRGTP